ncbi:uncharacterized protein [Aegilops tauschii subsp. strangulata]|uniref:uncharacterized protein isoform X1 n=1 Tax=Aegilops tauschii subsp. strangulata TaxID=200361 RepID=UPI003CC8CE17
MSHPSPPPHSTFVVSHLGISSFPNPSIHPTRAPPADALRHPGESPSTSPLVPAAPLLSPPLPFFLSALFLPCLSTLFCSLYSSTMPWLELAAASLPGSTSFRTSRRQHHPWPAAGVPGAGAAEAPLWLPRVFSCDDPSSPPPGTTSTTWIRQVQAASPYSSRLAPSPPLATSPASALLALLRTGSAALHPRALASSTPAGLHRKFLAAAALGKGTRPVFPASLDLLEETTSALTSAPQDRAQPAPRRPASSTDWALAHGEPPQRPSALCTVGPVQVSARGRFFSSSGRFANYPRIYRFAEKTLYIMHL